MRESATVALVIFDCDGVLVDSERLVLEIQLAAVRSAGWSATLADLAEELLGLTETDANAAIERHVGHPLPPDWEAPWEPAYARALRDRLQPVAGARDAVLAVRRAGHLACVASGGSYAKLGQTLATTGLADLFDGQVYSAEDPAVPLGKPAPDLFLYAARRAGVLPAQCVVVEDSRHGVAASAAAGMPVIGYAGGITPRSHLAGADLIVEQLAAVPAGVQQLLAASASEPGPRGR